MANLPQVSTVPAEILPPVSKTPAVNLANNWNNNRLLKVLLKEKLYLHVNVNSIAQRIPSKIIKTFLIEDYFHMPRVSMVHLEL
jgi:hypothetical protein